LDLAPTLRARHEKPPCGARVGFECKQCPVREKRKLVYDDPCRRSKRGAR